MQELAPMEKAGKYENGRVASPENENLEDIYFFEVNSTYISYNVFQTQVHSMSGIADIFTMR